MGCCCGIVVQAIFALPASHSGVLGSWPLPDPELAVVGIQQVNQKMEAVSFPFSERFSSILPSTPSSIPQHLAFQMNILKKKGKRHLSLNKLKSLSSFYVLYIQIKCHLPLAAFCGPLTAFCSHSAFGPYCSSTWDSANLYHDSFTSQ